MTLQQLTERERCQIEVPNTEGYTQTKIATLLAAHPVRSVEGWLVIARQKATGEVGLSRGLTREGVRPKRVRNWPLSCAA